MLYQSSPERRNFTKMKETQLFYLDIKLTKPFVAAKLIPDEKEKSYQYHLLLIIIVTVSTKKYDTDTSLSFHLVQAFGKAKGFVR